MQLSPIRIKYMIVKQKLHFVAAAPAS